MTSWVPEMMLEDVCLHRNFLHSVSGNFSLSNLIFEFLLFEGSREAACAHTIVCDNFDVSSVNRSEFSVFDRNFIDNHAVTFIRESWLLLVDLVVFTMSHYLSVTQSDFTSGHKFGLFDVESEEYFFSCFAGGF